MRAVQAFHPKRFSDTLPIPEMGEMDIYEWRPIGQNRWLSDNVKNRECDNGICVDFAMILSMYVTRGAKVTGLLMARSIVNASNAGLLVICGTDLREIDVHHVMDHVPNAQSVRNRLHYHRPRTELTITV